MVFNSWQFGAFFALLWLLYLALRSVRAQNLLLLAGSYWFYAAWDWRFLGLILASTAIDYVAGMKLHASEAPRARKAWMGLSLVANLGLLATFKYYGFFVESAESALGGLGFDASTWRLDLVLPVGISFYTFQTLSYTLDIYRRRMAPSRSLESFALYVAFFPQLVAGPIERAATLIPQIERPRRITTEGLRTGLWLLFWGLWKKVVIADNLAPIVEATFSGSAEATALGTYVALLAFALQIYCDFSGYSDVARGLARLMGFELMLNFNLPYWSRNPSDFWRRWHISLSTWLRDYLYVSLGGNRGGVHKLYRNLMLTMVLGGLWHGASANFVWWGVYQGALLCGHRWLSERIGWFQGRAGHLTAIFVNFQFTLYGWLIFRANRRVLDEQGIARDDSWAQLVELSTALRNGLGATAATGAAFATVLLAAAPLVLVQVLQARKHDPYAPVHLPRVAFAALCGGLLAAWILYGVQGGGQFLYFQF